MEMTPKIKDRLKIPPGCGWLSGKGAYSNCAKEVCPCRDKACGDTCDPLKAGGRGPFKCEKTPTAGGTFAICAPATSVKCTTTGQPTTTRKPFRLPTTTTPESIQGVTVDCSKAGLDFEYMSDNEIKRKEKFLPPGCILMSPRVSPRRGNFANCRKLVCPCQGKECGDTCDPGTLSVGSFKCQTRAKGFGCEPAASVECPNRVVTTTTTKTTTKTTTTTTTTTSNLRSTGRDLKMETAQGVGITTIMSTSTGSGKTTVTTDTDVTSKGSGKTTVATTETDAAAVTTVTKASASSATQGAKIVSSATQGVDERTAPPPVDEKTAPPPQTVAAAVADQGCAKEISLAVAVLLYVSLFLVQ